MKTGIEQLSAMFHPELGGINNVLYTLAAKIYELKPDADVPLPEISFSWHDWWEETKPSDIIEALASVGIAMGIVEGSKRIPLFRLSILNSIAGTLNKAIGISLGRKTSYTAGLTFVLFIAMPLLSKKPRLVNPANFVSLLDLPRLAMNEEVMYRWGSESWDTHGRFSGNLAFALLHIIAPPVRPLAVILPDFLGGNQLTKTYLKEFERTGSREKSVKRSATVHTTHNVTAIAVAIVGGIIITFLKYKRGKKQMPVE